MTIVAVGNQTASAKIVEGAGRLLGVVVATSTSGTLKVWDGIDGSTGPVIMNTTEAITAPRFWFLTCDFENGIYVTRGGTAANYTVIYEQGNVVMKRGRIKAFGNLSTDQKVYEGACRLKGFFVASSTSGTVRLYDNTAASGTVVLNTTTTLPMGWYALEADCVNGLYLDVGGTINVTVCLELNLP
jgi:hypothetical protein